jgi:hypothetical protein
LDRRQQEGQDTIVDSKIQVPTGALHRGCGFDINE